MANDSTNAGQVSSDQDSTQIQDGYFTDMQGEDAFFGPEQLAQAAAGGAPVQVPVPADQNVIRVQVTPGEILELSSPFDASAALLGREENGNLAIKVGDVTVILLGYVEANATAPVVVETSDGQPIDIATLLASTDPSIDIQTAAGPGDAAGAQGADNTGAILAQLNGGNGLGGLNAVGAQDQTELSYGLIDNSIRLDREDALSGASLSGSFKGLAEPFLRDPAHTNSASWFTFDDFKNEYTQYIDSHQATKGGWADFTGTQATNGDSVAFFLDTSFTVEIPHNSATPEQLNLRVGTDFFNGDVPTSNGETLVAEYLGGAFGDKSTIVLVRPSDGAVIMVFHVQESETTGAFHVEVYLVNRLDHHAEGQDVLSVGFNTDIYTPPAEGEESQGTTTAGPNGSVDILDDVPVAHDVEYTSYNGKDADSHDYGKKGGSHGHDDTDTTADGKGYVDEDWVKHGNKDHDNNPSGANSDDAHGDTIGRAIAKGNLNIDFGADGPAGADGNDCTFTLGEDSTLVLKLDTSLEAGFVNADGHVLDSKGNVVTSHGHELVILSDSIDSHGIEHLIVGYTVEHEEPAEGSDLVFAAAAESEGSCDVAVFELTLDLNPDDVSGKGMHFQDFKFELFKALDQDPNAPTVESNTDLQFKVVGHDDDGDTVHTAINIAVNDDSPTFEITYRNEDPRNCDPRDDDGPAVDARTLNVSGGDIHVGHYTTKDFGHVDEDWLNGDQVRKSFFPADNAGNHDRDAFYQDNANLYGDEKGGLEVCGQIKVSYGADGPSDAPGNGALGLEKYEEQPEGTYLTFVNGDSAHSTFTQNDVPLVVLYSSETKLVVGTAVEVDDGEGGSFFNETPVFCLELNPDTGKFDFHLLGAIDHDPATVDNNPESDLVLTFNVGSAEDFDHDTAIGAINIKVNDDHPEVGITYCNEDPHNVGDGYVVTDHKFDTDFGRVDEDWLSRPDAITNGSFESPKVLLTFDELNGPSGLSDWTIGDAGVDHIGNYWQPSDGSQSLDLSQHDAGSISRDLTGLVAGREYTIQFDMAGNPDGGPNTVELQVSVGSDSQNFSFDTTGHSKAAMGWEQKSFTFIATGATETLTFTSLTHTAFGPALDNVTLVSSGFAGNQDLDADGNSNANQYGDDYGSTHLSGQIVMKYGADGPGTQSIGLATITDATDAGGQPLTTQHGTIPLVVLHSTSDEIRIGYADENGDHTVFLLTLNSSGHFDFTQFEAIDHPIASPIEDNVYLTFKAGSITDGDGDTTDAVIKIQVNDDVPETSVTYSNGGEEDVPSPDTDSVITYGAPFVDYGQIDEDYLPNGNKDADNSTPGDPSDPLRGDEPGGTIVTGEIGGTTKYGADGPLGTPTNVFVLSGLGVDDPFTDAAGNQLKSHDHLLVVLASSDGTLEVGYHNGTDPDTVVFALTMTSDTEFKFELKEPLDHPQEKGDTVEQDIVLAFGADDTGAPTDQDSDPAARIVIHVNDDAPLDCEINYTIFTDASGEGEPTVQTGFGLVDEDNLTTGQGNLDTDNNPHGSSDPARGDTIGSAVTAGTITVDFGADGPADNAFTLDTYKVGKKFEDACGNTFESHGHTLKVLEVDAEHISVGYKDKSGTAITIFEFHLHQDGTFSFILDGPLDHAENSKPLEDTLSVFFNVTATDFDGDAILAKVQIKVNDDAPVAEKDCYQFVYAGNVVDNDRKGADGAKVTAITPDGGSETAVLVSGAFVTGAFGQLEIHQDGSWIYHPDTDNVPTGGTEHFQYTLTDGDGDVSTASIEINVQAPTHTPPATFNDSYYALSDLDLSPVPNHTAGNHTMIVDGDSGHTLTGYTNGPNFIVGNGGDDTITGGDQADILSGGDGNDTIHGGSGDDTLFGGNNDDELYGDAGADAMSGGAGDDTFHDVDADDLDGTNTLDGVHSIDGGTGTDTVQLGGLASFDSNDAKHVENVEVLDFKAGGANSGTAISLDYNAVYGITQVGGLHALTIHADGPGAGADTVNLQNAAGKEWTLASTDADFNNYTAGVGAAQVTVHVDKEAAVAIVA